jgi:hypothetical protein
MGQVWEAGPEVASPVELSDYASIIPDLFQIDDEQTGDRGLAYPEGSHDKTMINGVIGTIHDSWVWSPLQLHDGSPWLALGWSRRQ